MFTLTKLKVKCVIEFEGIISAGRPLKTDKTIYIPYQMYGEKKCIHWTPQTAAEFLERHGYIWKWRLVNGEARMFTKTLFTTTSAKGVPMQYERETPFLFSDIDISKPVIIQYAALTEFDAQSIVSKVVSLVNRAA